MVAFGINRLLCTQGMCAKMCVKEREREKALSLCTMDTEYITNDKPVY